MTDPQTMRVGVLCRRLDVPYRHVRYLLEEDILPEGVAQAPARGHHRQLTAAQAFWLGMVLKLKASGFAAPRAALIAGIAERLLTQSDTRRATHPLPSVWRAPVEGRATKSHSA